MNVSPSTSSGATCPPPRGAKAEGAQAKRASKQNRKFSRAAPRPGRRAYMAALSACHFNLQLSAFPRPPHGRWQASHARYRDLCIVARAERKVRGQGSGRHWDGAVWEAQGLAEARWTSKDNAAQARRKAVSAQLACECACY